MRGDCTEELLLAAEQMFIGWQYSEFKYGLYVACGIEEQLEHTLVLQTIRHIEERQAEYAAWVKRRDKLRVKASRMLFEKQIAWGPHDRYSLSNVGYTITKETYGTLGRTISIALRTDHWEPVIACVSEATSRDVNLGADISRTLKDIAITKGVFGKVTAYQCSICGKIHNTMVTPKYNTDYKVCPTCTPRYLVMSDVEGGYIMRDRAARIVTSYEGWRSGVYDFCHEQYVSEHALHVVPHYPSGGSVYVPTDLRDRLVADGVIEAPRVIGAYHSSKTVVNNFVEGASGMPFLGMELEVETASGSSSDAEKKARELLDKMRRIEHKGKTLTYCNTERDGSLRAGFEIVTAPCTLDVHAAQLKLLADVSAGLRSHNTTTCGLHVHIDRKGTSPLQRGKMVMFINSAKNKALVEAVARRYNVNHYAKILPKRLTNGTKDSADRYEAVNLTNRHTIEFRIFKGTLRYESIMACLEFTRAVWHFTRQAGFNELYAPQFVEWVNRPENRTDTPNLRQVLFEKGLLTGRPPLREMTSAPAGEK